VASESLGEDRSNEGWEGPDGHVVDPLAVYNLVEFVEVGDGKRHLLKVECRVLAHRIGILSVANTGLSPGCIIPPFGLPGPPMIG
jgi:hypothetical protein